MDGITTFNLCTWHAFPLTNNHGDRRVLRKRCTWSRSNFNTHATLGRVWFEMVQDENTLTDRACRITLRPAVAAVVVGVPCQTIGYLVRSNAAFWVKLRYMLRGHRTDYGFTSLQRRRENVFIQWYTRLHINDAFRPSRRSCVIVF